MDSVQINLCVKEPKTYLNYNLQSFKINELNFQTMVKEVKLLKPKQKKKYQKIAKSLIAGTLSFISLSSKSMAAPSTSSAINPMAIGGIPQEILEPLITLLATALGLSVALAMVLMISAGILRMLRQKEKAISWTTDIIKGLIQVLIAIPVVFLLYFIVTSLLGDFTIFTKPF
jgi:hypothetical protein